MSSQGSIQVHVFTSDANLPLEGAAVSIAREDAPGKYTLLSFQQTNSSGDTALLLVDTPAFANSQAPNRPVGFTNLRIAVDHPLYERVIVVNAQVFPDVTTLQDVQLVPLNILPTDWGTTQEFDITPQNL